MANPLVWPRAFIVQDQAHAWECWAAVLEAVTTFYLGAKYSAVNAPTAESITKAYAAAGGPSSQPGSAGDLEIALKTSGHYAGYQRAPENAATGRPEFQSSDANFNKIKAQIDAGHPVVCVFKYHAHAPRHCVLVYGYTDAATKKVRVADPHAGVTRKDEWDFTEFCSNYRALAHWKEVGLTKENEFANLGSLFD